MTSKQPKESNHFDKFSLSVAFDIDNKKLEERYLHLQMQFHPDKSSSEDLSTSIAISEAYKVLSDPINRGIYLLKLHNVNIDSDPSDVKPDRTLLEKILSLQEEIFSLSSKESVLQLKESLNCELAEILLQISESFRQKNTTMAALKLLEARYIKKSLDDLKLRSKSISSYTNI